MIDYIKNFFSTRVETKNREIDYSAIFKRDVIPVEHEDVIKHGETLELVWESKAGYDLEELIEAIHPQCGCTANITWDSRTVKAVYTNTEKMNEGESGVVQKFMNVYFRDGYGKIPRPEGRGMMWDPNKERVALSFFAKVRGPEAE